MDNFVYNVALRQKNEQFQATKEKITVRTAIQDVVRRLDEPLVKVIMGPVLPLY